MRFLLIILGYHPDTDPRSVGEYVWMPEHEAYVWEGRSLDTAEFNSFFKTWLQKQARIRGANSLNVRAIDDQLQGGRAPIMAHNQDQPGATPGPATIVETPQPVRETKRLSLAEAKAADEARIAMLAKAKNAQAVTKTRKR